MLSGESCTCVGENAELLQCGQDFASLRVEFTLHSISAMLQIDPAIGPRNGLYPASRNQQGAALEPASGFDVQIAEMPDGQTSSTSWSGCRHTIRKCSMAHTLRRPTTWLPKVLDRKSVV